MTVRLFIDGDDVLFMSEPGKPMKKFKVGGAMWNKTTNEWVYKLIHANGEVITAVSEKHLTMD